MRGRFVAPRAAAGSLQASESRRSGVDASRSSNNAAYTSDSDDDDDDELRQELLECLREYMQEYDGDQSEALVLPTFEAVAAFAPVVARQPLLARLRLIQPSRHGSVTVSKVIVRSSLQQREAAARRGKRAATSRPPPISRPHIDAPAGARLNPPAGLNRRLRCRYHHPAPPSPAPPPSLVVSALPCPSAPCRRSRRYAH